MKLERGAKCLLEACEMLASTSPCAIFKERIVLSGLLAVTLLKYSRSWQANKWNNVEEKCRNYRSVNDSYK